MNEHGERVATPPGGLIRRQSLLLVVVVAATIGTVFGLFEIVERTWLTDVDMQTRHHLYMLRGIGSSVIVALLITRSLIKTAPPLLVRPPTSLGGSESATAERRERKRIEFCTRWFIQMRWVAIVVAGLLVLLAVAVLDWLPTRVSLPLSATLAGLVVFNVVVDQMLRRRYFVHRLLGIQVFGDLIALNLLIHFSGGIENPLYILALFHVIIAGILLSRRKCLQVAVIAGFLCAAVAWSEWSGLLEHYTLHIVPHGEHGHFHASHQAGYVATVTLIFLGALLLTAYFVTRLSGQLRADERQLRKLADNVIAEHDRLEQALDTTATAVRVLDGDLKTHWANDKWNEWFGSTDPSGDGSADAPSPAQQAARQGRTQMAEVAIRRPDDTDGGRVYRIKTAPIADRRGSVREIVEIASDVTDEKKEQQRMMRASQLAVVGELASHVAHEVNNPITIMGGKARLLLSRYGEDLPIKVEQDLRKIAELSDRVGHVAEGLLSYARPSHGARRLIDVRAPVSESLDLARQRIGSTGIHVDSALGDAPLHVLGNAGELGQVFLNLFMNAIDAMPGGGTLKVVARAVEGTDGLPGIRVTVEDTGTGIPPAVRARIFEPFFTTKGDHKGTGLGLSICAGLLRSHGGSIHVESEPGRGTRFIVWLPVPNRETSTEPTP